MEKIQSDPDFKGEICKCDFCSSDMPIKAYPHPEISLPIGVTFAAGEWASCKECSILHEAGKTEELIERVLNSPHIGKMNAPEDQVRKDLNYIYQRISRDKRSILD